MKQVLLAASLGLATGCATSNMPAGPSLESMAAAYDNRVVAIRAPVTPGEHAEVCTYLRVERARIHGAEQTTNATVPPTDAARINARGMQSIALIESKMVRFQCDQPFQAQRPY